MSVITFEHNGVSYAMTEEQIYAAYRYQQHLFLREDALSYLNYMVYGFDDPEVQNEKDYWWEIEQFEEEYGISYSEAKTHLDAFVLKYQLLDDTLYDSETSRWEYAIDSVLRDRACG